MEERAGETDPVVARGHVAERARAEARLAGREHDQIGGELKSKYFVHLETPVLAGAGSKVNEGEQRVLLVEHAVRREVQDAASRGLTTERRFGCCAPGQHLYIRAPEPSDGRHFPPRRR